MSAYGPAEQKRTYPTLTNLPIQTQLKDGTFAELILIKVPGQPLDSKDNNITTAVSRLLDILNSEVEGGISYPQADPFDASSFNAYFLSHHAFALRNVSDPTIIYGGFYIKPNFPGRCDHICNAGFLVASEYRRLGAAKFMGIQFPYLARSLGYKMSMFNLVFENNVASLNLWKSLDGYQISGRIPKAGRLSDGTYVDAIQFVNDFDQLPKEANPSGINGKSTETEGGA